MFEEGTWPYPPTSLSDIIDQETLTVIESGCAARLGRPLTILDYDPFHERFDRIDPINRLDSYSAFCKHLRDCLSENQHCEQDDEQQALTSLGLFLKIGAMCREYQCRMHLLNVTHVIRVKGLPVAMLISGQYCPRNGLAAVHAAIDATIPDGAAREELHRYAEELAPAPTPAELRRLLQREAGHIEQIAEREYDHRRRELENAFLQSLEQTDLPRQVYGIDDVRSHVTAMLNRLTAFIDARHAVLFAATQPDETVLTPISWSSNLDKNIVQQLTFNWRKGLRTEYAAATLDDPSQDFSSQWAWGDRWLRIAHAGLRGQARIDLEVATAIPAQLVNGFCAVLVLGTLEHGWYDQAAYQFIQSAANLVCESVIIQLQALHLSAEREAEHRRGRLVVHRARQGLQQVSSIFGAIKRALPPESDSRKLASEGESEVQALAKEIQRTLESEVLEIEPDDLIFGEYSIAVLILNVIEHMSSATTKDYRTLTADPSLERLGYSYVDPRLLRRACFNLIENATKYSYPNTEIRIFAEQNLEQFTITVEDIGERMPEEARQNLLSPGQRWSLTDRGRRIHGTGFGLWDASVVASTHGGYVDFASVPLNPRSQAHRVRVWISIPWKRVPLAKEDDDKGKTR